jgi:Ca2+-binding EF-hand superfamily protein
MVFMRFGGSRGHEFGQGPVDLANSFRQKADIRGVVTPLNPPRRSISAYSSKFPGMLAVPNSVRSSSSMGSRGTIRSVGSSRSNRSMSCMTSNVSASFIEKMAAGDKRQQRLMMQQKQMQLSEALQKQMQVDQAGSRRHMKFDNVVSAANQAAGRMITLEDFVRPGTPPEERLQRRSPHIMESPLMNKEAGRVNLAEALGSDIRQKTPYAVRCDKRRKQRTPVAREPSPFDRPRLLRQLSVPALAQGESLEFFSQRSSSRSLRKAEPVRDDSTKRVTASIASLKRFQQTEVTLKRQVREKMRDLEKAFRDFDTDGGGTLDANEVRQVLYRFDILLEEKHFAMLLKKMDVDGDGEVSYEEFLKFFSKGGEDDKQLIAKVTNVSIDGAVTMIRDRIGERLEGGLAGLRRSFKFFDKGAAGSISFEEFQKGLKAYIMLEFEDDIMKKVFASFDEDGTGNLTFYNFTRMMMSSTRDQCMSLKFDNPLVYK